MPLKYYQEDCEASNSSSGEDSHVSDSVVFSPRKLHNKFLNVNKSRTKTNVKSNRMKSIKSATQKTLPSASSGDLDSVDETFKTSPTQLSASSKNIAEDLQNEELKCHLNQQYKKKNKSRMSFHRKNNKNDTSIMTQNVDACGEGTVIIPGKSESRRVFPFSQTPSGNLKVGPNQVVFESKKVSVLVADPKHTKVNVRAEIDSKTFIAGSQGESHPIVFGSEKLSQNHINEDVNDFTATNKHGSLNNNTDNYTENNMPSQLSKEYSLRRLSSTTLPAVDWNLTPLPFKTELFNCLLHRITNFINPDVEILISNEVFSCHLLVLQCYSDYFDQTKQASKMRLPEASVTPQAFSIIYNWMIYPGADSFRLLSRENIMEIFIASQSLGIKELEEQCWTFINCDYIFSEETAFLLYTKAKEMNNKTISQLMIPRIMRFFLKLVGTTNFTDLDLEDVCLLLKSNFIAVHNEIEVFMSSVRWLMHDWENRKSLLGELMKCVRFGWIAPWQLVDIRRNPENPEFMKVTSHCDVQQLIEDGLSYAIIKYWYGNQTQDYYHWIDLLGLQEPSQRNWIDEEKNYVTYREFLNDLEIYQQTNSLENMQLRSQQISAKADAFSLPPTVTELMAQRGTLMKEAVEKLEICKEKCKEKEEIDNLLPELDLRSKQTLKDDIKITFKNSLKQDFNISSNLLPDLKNSEHNLFLNNHTDFKNRDIEHHVYSKSQTIKADDGLKSYNTCFINKTPELTPQNRKPENIQVETEFPNKEDSSVCEPFDITTQVVKNNKMKSDNKKTEEERGVESCDKICTLKSLLSKCSQQKIYSHFSFITKDSLEPYQYMNQMNCTSSSLTHKKFLKEGSLFFADEEAVLVFGGIDPHKPYGLGRNTGKDIYRYLPHINAWELVGELPEPRHHHSVAFLRGKVFLAGGADPRNNTEEKSVVVNTVWSYNPVSRKWNIECGMLTPRKNFGLVVSNGKLYAIGGQDKKGCILSSVECFNPTKRVWEEMSHLTIGCMGIAAAKFRDFIWVTGGMTSSKSTSLSNSVACYDTRRNIWVPYGALRYSRCFSQLIVMNDSLYLIGGAGRINDEDYSTASISSVDIWDESSEDWKLKNEMAIPRHGHSVAYLGTQILIIGGVTTMYMRALSNVECFCCVRGTWICGVANLPTPLSGHGSVTLPPASLM